MGTKVSFDGAGLSRYRQSEPQFDMSTLLSRLCHACWFMGACFQYAEALIDGFSGRGLVTGHRLICRFLAVLLETQTPPILLSSITMAIPHV